MNLKNCFLIKYEYMHGDADHTEKKEIIFPVILKNVQEIKDAKNLITLGMKLMNDEERESLGYEIEEMEDFEANPEEAGFETEEEITRQRKEYEETKESKRILTNFFDEDLNLKIILNGETLFVENIEDSTTVMWGEGDHADVILKSIFYYNEKGKKV